MKKYLSVVFLIFWAALVFVGPYKIFKSVDIHVVLVNKFLLINFLQRITGVLAFILLFVQITLGSNMNFLRSKLGNWIFKFHLIEGVFTYSLFLIHPILYLLYFRNLYHTIDPFYVFTQVCLICKKTEIIYSLGRVAFWLGTLAVVAASFRDAPGWLSKNWRKVHILNYFVFFFIAIHGYLADSDFHIKPLSYIYWFSIVVVTLSALFRYGWLSHLKKSSR